MTLLLAVAALTAAGCGGSSNEESQSSRDPESGSQSVQGSGGGILAAADVDVVLEAQDSITTACGLTQYEEGSDIPLPQAIRSLQSVYRQNPDGQFEAGVSSTPRSMESVVEDNAKILRDCGKAAEADRLASVLPA